jgi:RNA polymerase sigma-70 factor (ECF subfamily)
VADVASDLFANDSNHAAGPGRQSPAAPGLEASMAFGALGRGHRAGRMIRLGPEGVRTARSGAAIMDRDNATWRTHLDGTGADQQAALSDLRVALLRGLRRALSHRPGADDASLEDIVQDSLLRILERLPQFEGRSRFLTWAMAIAIRVALSELRRRRWKDVSLDDAVAGADLAPGRSVDDDPGPDARREREAILEAMHEVIRDGLTAKQRAALLAELRGMPQDEIARHLGSNRNALYKLTHDARKRLKRGLESVGFTAEDIRAAFAR